MEPEPAAAAGLSLGWAALVLLFGASLLTVAAWLLQLARGVWRARGRPREAARGLWAALLRLDWPRPGAPREPAGARALLAALFAFRAFRENWRRAWLRALNEQARRHGVRRRRPAALGWARGRVGSLGPWSPPRSVPPDRGGRTLSCVGGGGEFSHPRLGAPAGGQRSCRFCRGEVVVGGDLGRRPPQFCSGWESLSAAARVPPQAEGRKEEPFSWQARPEAPAQPC